MALDLAGYEARAHAAARAFWESRGRTAAGDAMGGFYDLIAAVVRANGLADAELQRGGALPGYFCPARPWGLLVLHGGRLVAALACKAEVGPAFDGFNALADEAIGAAHDLQGAYRKGVFGQSRRPFVGWLILVEDAPGSRTPVSDTSRHFPVFPAFQGASYQQRYHLLCERLVREQLYSAACVITSPRTAADDGQYTELGELTGLRTFVASLAGHIATEAARG